MTMAGEQQSTRKESCTSVTLLTSTGKWADLGWKCEIVCPGYPSSNCYDLVSVSYTRSSEITQKCVRFGVLTAESKTVLSKRRHVLIQRQSITSGSVESSTQHTYNNIRNQATFGCRVGC